MTFLRSLIEAFFNEGFEPKLDFSIAVSNELNLMSEDMQALKTPTLLAAVATLLFALLTAWTLYPPTMDDFAFLWMSYLPDFKLADFSLLLTRRPIAVLQTYAWLKLHALENSWVLFWVYYFFHSLGVVAIFTWVARTVASAELRKAFSPVRSPGLMAIVVIAALYPGWYELTLFTTVLPYQMSVFFLGIALFAQPLWLRCVLLLLAFQSHESSVLPTFALLASPELLALSKNKPRASLARILRALAPAIGAAALFWLIQKLLVAFNQKTAYPVHFDWNQMFLGAKLFLFKLLWIESFYKSNWVSTLGIWVTILVGIALFLRLQPTQAKHLVVLALLPFLGAAHGPLLGDYYAPRAIHGAMVLKSVSIGVLLAECWIRYRPTVVRAAPVALLAVSYLIHHGLIVHSRGTNARLIGSRTQAIEQELKTCQSPCTIHAENLSDDLLWDWIIDPSCHAVVVQWIAAKNQIRKKLRVIPVRGASAVDIQ